MQAHQAVLHWSNGPAQHYLGLNSGSDIELEDQAKGRRGLVVPRNPATGERHLDELIWGQLPHGTKNAAAAPRPINARAKTVADHPMFAGAFRERRGIVPATCTTSAAQREVRVNRLRYLARMAVRWPLPASGGSSNGRTEISPGVTAS